MKRGVPPTALKARTGEFTPPGVTALARANRASDRSWSHRAIVSEAANRTASVQRSARDHRIRWADVAHGTRTDA